MNIYQPFTYLVTFLPTGQRYYGVRTKQGCHPSQLWNSYYTSSKTIGQLIEDHGTDAFRVEIRRVFASKADAILWEHCVLRRLNAAQHPGYLNKNNGDRKFVNHGITMNGKKHTEDAKRRMSINSSGAKNPNWGGKAFTEETRQKISKALAGTKPNISPESRAKRLKVGKENGMYGKKLHWYNNGEIQRQFEINITPPDGWVRGRLWSAGHREKMLEKRHPKRKGEP